MPQDCLGFNGVEHEVVFHNQVAVSQANWLIVVGNASQVWIRGEELQILLDTVGECSAAVGRSEAM